MINPVGLVYYNELLAGCFAAPEPPHQILCFCLRVPLDLAPADIVGKFADPAAPWRLDRIADFVAAAYARPEISEYRMRSMMRPLRDRLRMPIRLATPDPNWQQAHEALLEVHGDRLCGQTTLSLYDSGQLIEQLAACNGKEPGKCVEPVECLGKYVRRTLDLPYAWVLDRADCPLPDVCRELEDLCRERGMAGHPPPDLIAQFCRKTKLREYETSHLAADISHWVYRFGRNQRQRVG